MQMVPLPLQSRCQWTTPWLLQPLRAMIGHARGQKTSQQSMLKDGEVCN